LRIFKNFTSFYHPLLPALNSIKNLFSSFISVKFHTQKKINKTYCIICYYLLFFPIHFIVSSSFFRSCNCQQKMRREKERRKGMLRHPIEQQLLNAVHIAKKNLREKNSKVKRVKDHWLTSCEAERRETVFTAVNHLTIIK